MAVFYRAWYNVQKVSVFLLKFKCCTTCSTREAEKKFLLVGGWVKAGP